jgi:hypothetical protein
VNICIFLVSGQTLSFKDVELETDNESVVVFSYTAMSDGLTKTATFYKRHVAGVSITEL